MSHQFPQPRDNTWTGQQTFNTSATIHGVGVVTPKIYPATDSTTAVQILKANGSTPVAIFDTTNSRTSLGYTGAPEAYVDTLVGSNFTTPGLRIRQSNVPTLRYWDTLLANNGGNVALQNTSLESAVTYYSTFNTPTGQFGVGRFDTLNGTTLAGLDKFSVIVPALDATPRGITLFDANVERIVIQGSSNDVPQASLNGVQIATGNAAGLVTGGNLYLASRGNYASQIQFYTSAGSALAKAMTIDEAQKVGIGTATPSARLHVISTTEQFRSGYDASNYFSATVGSTGGVTFDAVGSGAKFTFTDQLIGKGTATNDDAAASYIGEYVSASVVQGSATALTTATPKTVTSISLTAGDWDINAIGSLTGASTGTVFDIGVSTTTDSFTGTVLGDTRAETPTVSLTGADASLMIPGMRVSISTTTVYYLVVSETFTLGSPAAYGRISARRVR